MSKTLLVLSLAILCLLSGQGARALTLAGSFWSVDRLRGEAAIEAALATVPDATFLSTALDYPNGPDQRLNGKDRRLSAFLGQDAASLPDDLDFDLSHGALFRFTGEAELNQASPIVTIAADNGFWLAVDGARVLSRTVNGGTAYASAALDGLLPGTHALDLVYWQDRGQLGLSADLPFTAAAFAVPPTPIAPSLPLLGSSFALLAWAFRGKRFCRRAWTMARPCSTNRGTNAAGRPPRLLIAGDPHCPKRPAPRVNFAA